MATSAELQAYLTQLYAARDAVLLRKSYVLMGRAITSADERWISEQIKDVEGRISRRGGGLRSDIVINPR